MNNENILKGKVTWFNDGAGFGNVRLDNGISHVLVPRDTIIRNGMQTLLAGEPVLVWVAETHGGLEATACLPLEREAVREV